MDLLADTCFFIDLQRGRNGASEWLAANTNARIFASVITYGELAAGFADRNSLDTRMAGIPLLELDAASAWIAGATARQLKTQGRMIGANDIWIAATAVSASLPVLTRNQGEFRRVPGLRIVSYGPS